MKNKTTIHKFFIYFVIYSAILPMISLGLFTSFVSVDTFKKELEKEDEIKVNLLSYSIKEYIRGPLLEINIIKEILEQNENNPEDEGFNNLLKTLTENNSDIWSIQITNLNGEIKSTFPNNEYLIGTDVSGYDYFKETISNSKPNWSSTFLSNQTNSTAVTISQKYKYGVITLFISIEGINSIINLLNNKTSNRLIIVTDQRGVYVYHPDYNKVLLRENDTFLDKNIVSYNGKKYFSNRVQMPETGWHISLYTPSDIYFGSLLRLISYLIVILIAIVTIAILIGKGFANKIYNSIHILLKSTQNISSGEYEISINEIGIEEFDKLVKSFKDMSSGIFIRESDLISARDSIHKNKIKLEKEIEKQNEDLKSALENLSSAEEKMIESEKLAGLGGMVAGVAHEINTPIGIIVTAASYLNEQTEELVSAFKTNTMAKSQFIAYCENVLNTTKLILTNSKRSSNLISSFKHVAVDQSSEEIRTIYIKDYIDEILTSLNPNFKNRDYKVVVECDTSIIVRTIPGAIAQIFTNLILNSIKHGFENRSPGRIDIKIELIESVINLTYSDNGNGMRGEDIKRIYDPFFTTKREQGGSGIGMNIVYNLVTKKLKGTIDCKSTFGEGITFYIKFPSNL